MVLLLENKHLWHINVNYFSTCAPFLNSVYSQVLWEPFKKLTLKRKYFKIIDSCLLVVKENTFSELTQYCQKYWFSYFEKLNRYSTSWFLLDQKMLIKVLWLVSLNRIETLVSTKMNLTSIMLCFLCSSFVGYFALHNFQMKKSNKKFDVPSCEWFVYIQVFPNFFVNTKLVDSN